MLVLEDNGDGQDTDLDGSTFDPAANETVTVTLTNSNGANALPAGPFVVVTDAFGLATVTFASATAGLVTGHAKSDVSVGGLSLHRETDGLAGNSGDAKKRYVDAQIKITPDDTNEVGQPHTFTVLVLEDNGGRSGYGLGWLDVRSGRRRNSDGDADEFQWGECVTGRTVCGGDGRHWSGDGDLRFGNGGPGDGPCHVGRVGGVVCRCIAETNGLAGNSGDAVKRYVDAKIKITPDDNERSWPSRTRSRCWCSKMTGWRLALREATGSTASAPRRARR